MKFAIYGRKSVYSDHSDSVDNQFRMCREYIAFRFSGKVDIIEQYSDEDYTGANTDRPDLQRLLSDVKAGLVDVLVVYQLDRLSRDVRDFSNIYSLLEEKHVMFVSIKENIDTNTPIGKAMMYVTVVFAQMERETIAARVTDNMLGLAKKGYWTGGNPPVGYVRKKITVNGKNHVTIEPDPEGVKYVTWIFDTFLDKHSSLQNMETSFRHQGIKTIRGSFFSTTQLYSILTMPFCVPSSPEIYDFYAAKGCQMIVPREQWTGNTGVMIYGRTTEKNKKHERQPPEKWIVLPGLQKPFIPAEKWLAVQKRFSENKYEKTLKYDTPLLKGVLRCSCGALMGVSRKKRKSAGVSSWYYCRRRMRMGAEVCNCSQINVNIIDAKALQVFRAITADPGQIKKYINSNESEEKTPDTKSINIQIASYESRIGRLTSVLAASSDSSAAKYIVAEMERLDGDLQALKRERIIVLEKERKKKEMVKSAEEKAGEIAALINGMDGFSDAERNMIVKKIVKECTWDGKELFLRF